VNAELVARFNGAVTRAEAGDHAGALAGYRELFALQRTSGLAASPRFLAAVHLEASYALIDLGKVADAEAELLLIDPSTLDAKRRYDYFFTLGNVLGGERKLPRMFTAFVQAISVAEDGGDLTDRPKACWLGILRFTTAAGDWPYLKEVSDKAVEVARVRHLPDLETTAKVAQAEAKKHGAR
jgi:hypothetical protein